jgi:hypothetical protein
LPKGDTDGSVGGAASGFGYSCLTHESAKESVGVVAGPCTPESVSDVERVNPKARISLDQMLPLMQSSFAMVQEVMD